MLISCGVAGDIDYDSEIYANGSGNSHGSGTAGRFKRSPPEGIGGGGRNQPRNSRYQVRLTKKLVRTMQKRT